MLRVTVRMSGLLLLVLGLALLLAKGGSRLETSARREAASSLSPRPTQKHKTAHSSAPLTVPKAPSVPPPSAFARYQLLAYRWLAWVFRGERLLPFGVPLTALGSLLFLTSFFLPKSKAGGLVVQKGTVMQLPDVWDERQISLDIEQYRGNPGLLSTSLDGIVTRFLAGQKVQTVEARTKYLETLNKYGEVARENYKWKRIIDGGRARHEEDLADTRAKIALEKAKAELDEVGGDHLLAELQKEEKRLEVMVQIAQRKKELKDLSRRPPPPPIAPPKPTAAEERAKEKAELDEREKQVLEAIRIVTADPTLSDEQRRRKLNALEERLAEIHERQAQLL